MKERFEKRIPILPETVIKLGQIDDLKGQWRGGIAINLQILGKLKKSVIITSTGASTRIEGAKMTDMEIERFLNALKSNPPENRDEEEVAGYANLLGRIFDNWKTLKLSESFILQFHEILLHYSKKDELHKGKYKSKENRVVARNKEGMQVIIFEPTEPWLVKKEMDDALFWANETLEQKRLHPLLVIANFIFEFLAIHPFEDGNGRLSRALTNLLLLKAGYEYIPYVSLEEIIENKKDAYYASLRQSQKNHKTETENIGPWLTFFLDVLFEQARRAQELMENDDPMKLLSKRQLQVFSLFNTESLAVMEIKKKLPKVPVATIKQALARLVTLKLIERIGLGRATRYMKIGNK
jgi:Fic family protein